MVRGEGRGIRVRIVKRGSGTTGVIRTITESDIRFIRRKGFFGVPGRQLVITRLKPIRRRRRQVQPGLFEVRF